MSDKAAVFSHIQTTLVELFELDPKDITLEAELYDGLDIDSIDAVDLTVELKKYTGKKISPNDFKTVRTVNDLVESVLVLLNNNQS